MRRLTFRIKAMDRKNVLSNSGYVGGCHFIEYSFSSHIIIVTSMARNV